MFIAGAVVIGGAALAHDNHSNYHDWSEYNEYQDAKLRAQIASKQDQYDSQSNYVSYLREQMIDNFNDGIRELRNEQYYIALDGIKWSDNFSEKWDEIKAEMRDDLNREIQAEQSELEQIDRMIEKINELAMQ
ncbi:MAG: hypothetical protein IJ575_00615 [Selenomonadaceae bacterium]|nr:hypothetical protein [Selenomonadaceae bacterium]